MDEQPGARGNSSSITWSQTPSGRTGPKMNSHRLNQNVVLAIEQGGPGVLVQGLYIVTGGEGRPVIHAATRMPFLDLAMCGEVADEVWSDHQGPGPLPTSTPSPELSQAPSQCPTVHPTHAEGRTLGGRVLSQVQAVDAVPLDKLVG